MPYLPSSSLVPLSGNLPESSVVNVSQVFTVDKRLLTDSIGRLSQEKIKLIIQGIKLVIEPQELE